jgi:hypothetical protein
MTAICAKGTVRVDVNRTLKVRRWTWQLEVKTLVHLERDGVTAPSHRAFRSRFKGITSHVGLARSTYESEPINVRLRLTPRWAVASMRNLAVTPLHQIIGFTVDEPFLYGLEEMTREAILASSFCQIDARKSVELHVRQFRRAVPLGTFHDAPAARRRLRGRQETPPEDAATTIRC